jgi:hypothetical protein
VIVAKKKRTAKGFEWSPVRMKKTAISVFLCAFALLLLVLAGCGSETTYVTSPDSLATVPFRGVVEDGPIAGARISLRDSAGTYYPLYDALAHGNYEVKTDRSGTFSLEVKAGIEFSHLTVVAVGGIDRDTGIDFNGLEMRSPLGLFPGDMTAIVVSPLTTLAAELHDQGFTFEEAEQRLRVWLALSADANLTARPATHLDLQRRTLLLTKIVHELDTPQPFRVISRELVRSNTALLEEDGSCNQGLLSALGLDELERARVSRLQNLLLAPPVTSKEAALFFFKREELIKIFAANFQQMLSLPAPLDAQQQFNYQRNLEILAEKTLFAAGSEVFLFVEPIPSRLFRYLLSTYKLTTPERLTLDATAFSAVLSYKENDTRVALENDPWIAMLARSSSPNSVDSPLLATELPGDDNQRRLAYFYGSDLSPHFQAEQLLGRVFDDAVNDSVFLKIIEGKANAGLIDETRMIIATQIMQPEPQGNAYRALADALIKFHQFEAARRELDFARDLYRQVLASKGQASANATDVGNLLQTAASYRKAGDLLNAQRLLDDVAALAQILVSDAIIYGKLISGIKNVVDAYIAAGDLDAAAPLVQAMHHYSSLTPSYLGNYKLRIYNWSESAKRYADLGNQAMVVQISNEIKALRAADGLKNLTGAATWVYIPSLVESLYRVGETQTAYALANTIPSGSTNQIAAFKLVAVYEAVQGHLQSAFTITDNPAFFPAGEDKLALLTYFAANRKNPGIALALLNAGRYADARLALVKAEEVLAGMTASPNLARIRYGYVKVAELYAELGDIAKAAALLQSAETAVIDDIYSVAVQVDIALGYHNLNQTSTALSLLAAAQAQADSNPTRFRADTTPNLSQAEAAALLYEACIKAYEKIGDRERVATTVMNSFLPWAQEIATTGTVNDLLAGKEVDILLRGALYLERAGYHSEALLVVVAARASSDQIAVTATRLGKYLGIIAAYATMREYDQALTLALSLTYASERNKALQALANAYIDRNDFPLSPVASIDSDADGQPDFFHPLASFNAIAASGLFLDSDSDGDGIPDIRDIRPLFAD